MKNKIFMILTFLASVLLLSSCLKDKIGEDWTSSLAGKMYAEIPGYGAQAFVIQPIATDQVFKFLVNIASDAVPTTDIVLKFKIDTVAMNKFSDATQLADTSIHWRYTLFPNITILDPTLTIKAGSRNAYVHVKLTGADTLPLSTKYMAPITMYSATGGNVIIASNKVSILYKLPIANKWEGTYAMSGTILRNLPPIDPALSGYYTNRVYKLGTTGPNSVMFNAGLSWAGNNGYVGGVGKWTITISEGSVPNPITVRDFDAPNPAVTEDAAYPNRYDPATKTFYMSVYWGAGPLFRATTDTLVYIGKY